MRGEWLVDVPVGTRVVVRYLIEGGDRATDVLGTLTERDGQQVVVDTPRQGQVRIDLADIVAAKPVPPPPEPRRRRPEAPVDSLAIVGAGRLGTAFAAAFRAGGVTVDGPLGRGADPAGVDAILLTVPDRAIGEAARALTPREGVLVGHCSGATGLEPLSGHEAFSLHPLMTIPEAGARFTGATAAVAGSTSRALARATALATALGMRPVEVRDEDRVAYHAAAAVASNFLTTVLDTAERLAGTAGLERDRLVPIVRASVENWARDGGPAALTGPVARGDESTVTLHREAVAARVPEALDLFDSLVAATRLLANRPEASSRDS